MADLVDPQSQQYRLTSLPKLKIAENRLNSSEKLLSPLHCRALGGFAYGCAVSAQFVLHALRVLS